MPSDSNTTADRNEWRETLRDLYDDLHFGPDNVFTGNTPLAARLVAFIEKRHADYFCQRAEAPHGK